MRGELLLWLLTKKVLGSGKKIICDGKTLTCDQRNWFRNGALQLQNYWAIGSTPNYYFRRKHPLSACYFLSCKYHSIRVLHTLEHIISDCLLMWNVCFCSCMMIEKWALTADYYSYVLLLLLISIPSGAWWKWTTTAPGSTTAVATWITPTSPASCSWLHWVAHTLPLSSLWLCTHSCMRGWAVTCAGPTMLLMSCYHSSRPNPHQANKAVSSFFTADIIRLEYCKDWHECCASISAPHALQCACLRCYTLCLRFGTWHHYCRWYAFRYTGEFFLSFANLTSFWLKKKKRERHLSDYFTHYPTKPHYILQAMFSLQDKSSVENIWWRSDQRAYCGVCRHIRNKTVLEFCKCMDPYSYLFICK